MSKINFLFISLLFIGTTGRIYNIEKPDVIVILTDDQGRSSECVG